MFSLHVLTYLDSKSRMTEYYSGFILFKIDGHTKSKQPKQYD